MKLSTWQPGNSESEERIQALLQAIPDAIFRVHRSGIYRDCKAPASFKMILPVEEMVGQHHQEFLPAQTSRLLTHAIKRALRVCG